MKAVASSTTGSVVVLLSISGEVANLVVGPVEWWASSICWQELWRNTSLKEAVARVAQSQPVFSSLLCLHWRRPPKNYLGWPWNCGLGVSLPQRTLCHAPLYQASLGVYFGADINPIFLLFIPYIVPTKTAALRQITRIGNNLYTCKVVTESHCSTRLDKYKNWVDPPPSNFGRGPNPP